SFLATGISTATGISIVAGNFSTFNNMQIINFQTGVSCAGTGTVYVFDNCQIINNGTGLLSNDASLQCNNCIIFGANALAANTGISLSGAGSYFVMSGGSCALCETAINIDNNVSSATINAASFKFNTTDINQTGASKMTLSSCNFEVTNNSTDINIQINGAGTLADIIGCEFNGA